MTPKQLQDLIEMFIGENLPGCYIHTQALPGFESMVNRATVQRHEDSQRHARTEVEIILRNSQGEEARYAFTVTVQAR